MHASLPFFSMTVEVENICGFDDFMFPRAKIAAKAAE